MKNLTISVKFQKDDTIYTTKKVKAEEPIFPICEGKKTITYNGKEMRCPECNGRGSIISNKFTNIVCDEPFVISATKITVNSDGRIIVKYKGHCGYTSLNRAEDNLFETKEQAVIRCKKLNKETIFINVSDINIQESFKNTPPAIEKIQDRLEYYKANNKFNKEIIINKDNILLDGYITYLICKLLNIDVAKVIVEDIPIKEV